MKPFAMSVAVGLLLVAGGGCYTYVPPSPVAVTVPGLSCVDSNRNIWRSAQPLTIEQWELVQHLGISNVVKLNEAQDTAYARGVQDTGALVLGLTVWNDPIDLPTQMGITPSVLPGKAALAVSLMRGQPGTLVHCLHGEDRTGLVVALYRLEQGWPAADAEAEMLAQGFHKVLRGLWEYWEQEAARAAIRKAPREGTRPTLPALPPPRRAGFHLRVAPLLLQVPADGATGGPMVTLAWNAVTNANPVYTLYGGSNTLTVATTNGVGFDERTNRVVLWSGSATSAAVSALSGWHVAVTATALAGESPPSNEVVLPAGAVSGTNRVTTVRVQTAATVAGPWTNGPVVFTGTNVTGSQYWRVNITNTLQ